MKILIINGTYFPAQYGGASNMLYWLTKGLISKNIKVQILTTSVGIDNKNIEGNWVNMKYGNIYYSKTKNLQFPLKLILKIPKLVIKNEIIHVNGLFYPPSLIAAIWAFFFNKKIIWSVHGVLSKKALEKNRFIKKFFLKIIKIINYKITFHCTNENEVNDTRLFFTKAKIIKIPIYMELPKKLTLSKKNQICYLGRIHPIKGLENLIHAVKKSKTFKESNFKLIIAGDKKNDFAKKLEKEVNRIGLSKKIIFIGHVSGKDKQNLLAESKWLILPSFSENFGIVVIEALAQSTPVIASHFSPWKSLINNSSGFWISNKTDAISRKLDEVVGFNLKKQKLFESKAFLHANTKFNIYENTDTWISAYQSL